MEPLSVQQIEIARKKILLNAVDLIAEAELLLTNGKHARAYTLAHLACEEMAKLPMLVRAVVDSLGGNDVDWKKLGRRLSSHEEKIALMEYVDFLFDPDTENDADLKRLKASLKKVKDFNLLKNLSLYTSVSDGDISHPSEVITPDLSSGMVKLAQNRLRFFFQRMEELTRGKLSELVKASKF